MTEDILLNDAANLCWHCAAWEARGLDFRAMQCEAIAWDLVRDELSVHLRDERDGAWRVVLDEPRRVQLVSLPSWHRPDDADRIGLGAVENGVHSLLVESFTLHAHAARSRVVEEGPPEVDDAAGAPRLYLRAGGQWDLAGHDEGRRRSRIGRTLRDWRAARSSTGAPWRWQLERITVDLRERRSVRLGLSSEGAALDPLTVTIPDLGVFSVVSRSSPAAAPREVGLDAAYSEGGLHVVVHPEVAAFVQGAETPVVGPR